MTRHISRISLVMLLGVVTSVAVAWGLAWRAGDFQGTTPLQRGWIEGAWPARVPETWPNSSATIRVVGGLGAQLTTALWEEKRSEDDKTVFWQEVARFGWPLISLQWQEQKVEELTTDHLYGPYYIETSSSHRHLGRLVAMTSHDNEPLALPYHPIYPGLLANTAIYGSAWFAILFGPGMLIRWRRRRAGRCAKCAYDLRGSNPRGACPECGRRGDTAAR